MNELEWIDDEEFEDTLGELVGLELVEIVHEVDYDVLIFIFKDAAANQYSLTPWGTWHVLYRAQSVGGYIGGHDHDMLLSDTVEHIVKRRVMSTHFWRERAHIYLEFDNGYWVGMFNTEKYLGYELLVQKVATDEVRQYKVRDSELTRSVLAV